MHDIVYVTIVMLTLGTLLWCRRKAATVGAPSTFTTDSRIAPYREPLVPENFWTSCMPLENIPHPTIVWILREYLPHTSSDIVRSTHLLNRQMVARGIHVVVIVPEAKVKFYDDVQIIQFHERYEIEAAIRLARCICTQYKVIETAAYTSLYSRKPLVLFCHSEMSEWIRTAAMIRANLYLVNNSMWLDRIHRSHKIPSIVLHPPIFWKTAMTHTSRKYILCTNVSDNEILVCKLALAFPDYKFMAVSDSKFLIPVPPNIAIVPLREDMRKIYAETDILCSMSSESWSLAPLEAAASGIPVISYRTEALADMLPNSIIYVSEEGEWMAAIRKLKGNAFFHSEQSKAISLEVKDLRPAEEIDKFKLFLESTLKPAIHSI